MKLFEKGQSDYNHLDAKGQFLLGKQALAPFAAPTPAAGRQAENPPRNTRRPRFKQAASPPRNSMPTYFASPWRASDAYIPLDIDVSPVDIEMTHKGVRVSDR